MTRTVHHLPDLQRFEIKEDGHTCVLNYHTQAAIMTVTHTGVPSAVGGRGIAADLTAAALDYAKTTILVSYPNVVIRRLIFVNTPSITRCLPSRLHHSLFTQLLYKI